MADHGGTGDVHADERLRAAWERLIGIFRPLNGFAAVADAMTACGTFVAALRLGPGGCEAVYRNQCRQRLCPFCATLKGSRHRAALSGVIDERLTAGARFTLMTLTIPHKAQDSLRELLGVLFTALALFRKTAFFKKHIRAWARGIEVTWSAKNGFHPHPHFLVEAAFMNLDDLHRAWATCVRKAGGGEVERQGIDLKGLNDSSGLKDGKGLNEAIGYPFKVQGLLDWPPDKVVELARAVKHRRLYQACRKWSRRIDQLEEKAELLSELEGGSKVVRFADYLDDVRQGDARACAALLSVRAMLITIADLDTAVERLDLAAITAMRGSIPAGNLKGGPP